MPCWSRCPGCWCFLLTIVCYVCSTIWICLLRYLHRLLWYSCCPHVIGVPYYCGYWCIYDVLLLMFSSPRELWMVFDSHNYSLPFWSRCPAADVFFLPWPALHVPPSRYVCCATCIACSGLHVAHTLLVYLIVAGVFFLPWSALHVPLSAYVYCATFALVLLLPTRY